MALMSGTEMKTRTRGSFDSFVAKRALIREHRTPLATLLSLREAWMGGDLERHVAMSGQCLGQLASRPWFAASSMLDAAVVVARRFGMDGIFGVSVSCLSAAWVLSPRDAGRAANEFASALVDADGLVLQRDGVYLFLDLERMAGAAALDAIAALSLRDEERRPWAIDGRPDALGGVERGTAAGLLAGMRSKGGFVSAAMLSAVSGGKAHDALRAIVDNRPSGVMGGGALAGFGLGVRAATEGDPWFSWKGAAVGHVSAGGDGVPTANKNNAGKFEAILKAVSSALKADGKSGSFKIKVWREGGSTDVENPDATIKVDANGEPDQPVPQDAKHIKYTKVKTNKSGQGGGGEGAGGGGGDGGGKASGAGTKDSTPLPDDVGGDDYPAVLGDFASQGLLPWMTPVDNALGDGPAMIHYSRPSVIDPGSEAPSDLPLTADELERLVQWINATKFWAYINPVPFRRGGEPLLA